ncbi:hypothetical protein ACFSTE_20905 [Aquimarina hainanensis]|uniref:Uncharacterized protein n=1 Tax=Aquimarina hainanensis TaxID=1578017 RepID=A0ABW5NEG6_9FLAO|nr:hypothetical protein [Aquimarina sp. TRL1]QKX07207.1 hypothetical protein HN014_20570 [Aquimarina sp. TRL1]
MQKIKKYSSFLFVIIGGGLLLYEVSKTDKNYYFQVIGIVLLMSGLFLFNTRITSKTIKEEESFVKEEFLEEE